MERHQAPAPQPHSLACRQQAQARAQYVHIFPTHAAPEGKPATAEVESMSSSSLEKGTKGTKIKNNKDVKTNYEDDTELFKELQSWKTEHER